MTSPVRAAACAGCGGALTVDAVACAGCGAPVHPAERRVVTLLFADLAGYTSLCETRDPEQVHLLVRPLMNALRSLCEERGGVVPGIQGDGFMAVFGARSAQEDDPTHALDAAVRLQRSVEDRRLVMAELPRLRVGLHVGEVLVASSWETSGLSVAGDAVNVASRVCSAAEPGQILATSGSVDVIRVPGNWGAPREVQVRGREALVSVSAYDWVSAPDVVRGPRWSAASPYVSRAPLEAALASAIETSGAVLVGGAGMGKTRLAQHVLAGRRLLSAAPSAIARPSASTICADLLEQLPHPPQDLVELLRGGGSDGLAEESLQLRAAGGRLAEQAPDAVVLVDDGELLDPDEAGLLQVAMAASGLAWVVASRTPRPELTGLATVEVPAWSTEESERLLEATLPLASPELRRAVLERSGDCPLFVEQCVRLLLETGAVEVDSHGAQILRSELLGGIPSSMRLFVSSRLDLLTPDERSVLGIAAVLGTEPDLALLRHLAGPAEVCVEPLVESGFLRWTAGTAGQPHLRFSHALVRDVAYETQLRSRRVEIHRAAAEWYAVLPVAQVLEAQAYHLEQAVNLEEPDCDLLRRAVEAMVLFARSIEEERTRVGREVLQRARALAEGRPQCSVDLLALELATASVEHLAGNQLGSREAAARALELAERAAITKATAEAHLHLGKSYRYEDNERAEAELQLAETDFREVGDPAGVARTLLERGMMAGHHHGMHQFLGHLDRAYTEAMRSADVRLQSHCAQQLALHHAFVTGRTGFALWADHARDVSRRDDVGLEPRLDLAAAGLGMFGLDPLSSLDASRRALSAGRDLGLAHVYHNALVITLDLLLLAGQLDEAVALLSEARSYATRYRTDWLSLQFDLLEARIRQRRGEVELSTALLDGVANHELASQQVMRRDLAEARAWTSLERGRFGEARALAAEAVAVDLELGERCAPLRPRLVELVATTVLGQTVPLGTIADLRALARETELGTVAQMAMRWLYVDELTRGWTIDLHGLSECGVVECRALDLEIGALTRRDWSLLLRAAEVWSELGTTVWRARALLWHSELTGMPAPEADELLRALDAPTDLAEFLRAQVRGLLT